MASTVRPLLHALLAAVVPRRLCAVLLVLAGVVLAGVAPAAPRVIVISLDGATPRFVDDYLARGVLERDRGLGLLRRHGITARQNVTINPSLTAPGHIAIATGSIAAHNDIAANTFHLQASPFTATISGFSAPIGGYDIHGPAEAAEITAEPLWLPLRAAGKVVATATFPGGDGLDIRVPGRSPSPIVQPAAERTVDYTVPFGAFAGVGAQGFSLTAADFSVAPSSTTGQLAAAGRTSFSPTLQKVTPLETFTVGGVSYQIQVAALDTTNDGLVNYDMLVFFDTAHGIPPGPFNPPSTGPAYVRPADKRSGPFYLEGSSTRAGTGFYVSRLEPDLSSVRIARYSANAIPRNAAVLGDVDDVNNHAGFWAPQPDFRIPERLSPGFDPFPDLELEAIYQDLVRLFVDYQTRVGLRAIERFPDADLIMIYIEQPDGSGHQFLLTDPRQPTDPRNPDSIGGGQDPDKVARYARYHEAAYRAASTAVQRIIEAVGTDRHGMPRSNIIVVSDHGFEIFHTAVSMMNLLVSRGFDPTKVRAVTSGPAVNVYVNLIGRGPSGTVTPAEYLVLQGQIADALAELVDTNPNYTNGLDRRRHRGLARRPGNLREVAAHLLGCLDGALHGMLRGESDVTSDLGRRPDDAAHRRDPDRRHEASQFGHARQAREQAVPGQVDHTGGDDLRAADRSLEGRGSVVGFARWSGSRSGPPLRGHDASPVSDPSAQGYPRRRAARFSASTRSSRSHGTSRSVRPKWP